MTIKNIEDDIQRGPKVIKYFLVPAVLLIIMISSLNIFWPLESRDVKRRSASFYKEFFAGEIGEKFPKIDVVILGDSTAKSGIAPHVLTPFGINLALNAGTSLTSYYTLKRFVEFHAPPKCIILASQLTWRINIEEFEDYFVLPGIFGWFDLWKIWRMSRDHNTYPSRVLSLPALLTMRLNAFRTDTKTRISEFQKSLRVGRGLVQKAKNKEITSYRDILRGFSYLPAISSQEKFFVEDRHHFFLSKFRSIPDEDIYLEKIIELADNLNAKLIFTFLPFSKSPYAEPSMVFRATRVRHMLGFFEKHPNIVVPLLPEFMERKYFYNFTHLNGRGAEKVTSYLSPIVDQNCTGSRMAE